MSCNNQENEVSVCDLSTIDSLQDKDPINRRFIRKKRIHSASFSHSGINGLTIDGIPSDLHSINSLFHKVHLGTNPQPFSKNSRKSRDGRKIPHKRSGKNHDDPTEELDEIELDPNDPDYDSDSVPVMLEELQPVLSDEEFEKKFTDLLHEFFIHGKTKEVVNAVLDLNFSLHQRRRILYLAIVLAMQYKHTQCQLTSELLSDMCGKVLDEAQIQQGFQFVLNEIGDLNIDFPKAHEYIGRFIARAIVDDILPPKFIETQRSILMQSPYEKTNNQFNTGTVLASNHNVTRSGNRNLSDSSNSASTCVDTSVSSGIGSVSSLASNYVDIALSALSKAETLLALRHSHSLSDNIWGVPTGPKATKMLIKRFGNILRSYVETNDIRQAKVTLSDLDSPHFHHQLVFQSIIMVIESNLQNIQDIIIQFLKEFVNSAIISQTQLELGISRVYSELNDLQIDVPYAYPSMKRFIHAATRAGFIEKDLLERIQMKERKRFISESDSVYRSDY